ncbi:MAG: VCBS repeat-containing protein [Planctomycetota bacterium]
MIVATPPVRAMTGRRRPARSAGLADAGGDGVTESPAWDAESADPAERSARAPFPSVGQKGLRESGSVRARLIQTHWRVPRCDRRASPSRQHADRRDLAGDVDLLLAKVSAGASELLLNDGSGAFEDESSALSASGFSSPARLLDVDADGDGDLDVVGARGGAGIAGFASNGFLRHDR